MSAIAVETKSQPLAALLTRAETLYRDVELSAVSEWKARTGQLAVGYLPIYAPRELLWAQGVLPVGLMGGGEDVEIIRGDAYYQSYICHLPRSVIELGLSGRLDTLDGLLFPAICDVIRNLSGIWKSLFPEVFARYLDVPQDFSPELGGVFWRHELTTLADELTARGAQPLTDDRLREAIALYNTHREQVAGLYRLRQEKPWKVPTHELYVILRAGLMIPVEDHVQMLTQYGQLVEADKGRVPLDQARVLVAGSFCEQPPLGLIRTLERAGCYVVEDDFVQVHRFITGAIPTEGDPLANLVQAFLTQAVQSPTRYIDEARKGDELIARVRASGAEGVLFAAPSFCDPALLDQPMATGALDRAGIPWTGFKYAENTGQFQVIREQAGTFADALKLYS